MTRSIFGWSYPPGCSGPPNDDVEACYVCGLNPDDCICPECPICGTQGDPDCYKPGYDGGHGLERSEEQLANLKRYEDYIEEYNTDEEDLWEKSLINECLEDQ